MGATTNSRSMMIEEITDGEIEAIVQDVGQCVRARLRRFAAEKKERRLLDLLNSSILSEAERLYAYFEQTDYLPTSVSNKVTVYARPYSYLVEELHLTPAKAKRLVKKLATKCEVTTQVLEGELHVVFPQATRTKSR